MRLPVSFRVQTSVIFSLRRRKPSPLTPLSSKPTRPRIRVAKKAAKPTRPRPWFHYEFVKTRNDPGPKCLQSPSNLLFSKMSLLPMSICVEANWFVVAWLCHQARKTETATAPLSQTGYHPLQQSNALGLCEHESNVQTNAFTLKDHNLSCTTSAEQPESRAHPTLSVRSSLSPQ